MPNQNVTLKLTLSAANRIHQTLTKRLNELTSRLPSLSEDEKRELGEINDIINREFG